MRAHVCSLDKLYPTLKVSGRGVWADSPAVRGKCRVATKGDGPRAGRPERSPAGDFQGDSSPLERSFASFSGVQKRKAPGGSGAWAEWPPTPGPLRFDRIKNSEAVSFKIYASPGQNLTPGLVKPNTSNCVFARAGRKAKLRCVCHRDIVPTAMVFPRRLRRATRITCRLSLPCQVNIGLTGLSS